MDVERVFRGTRMQRGYGLGGFFSAMFRRAIPLLKSGGKYLFKKAAKTGISSIRDIASGMEPRTAVKRRIADVSDEMLDDVKRKIRRKMTGGGRRKKNHLKKKKKKKKGGKKKKKGDKKKPRQKKRIMKRAKKRGKICGRRIKDIFDM